MKKVLSVFLLAVTYLIITPIALGECPEVLTIYQPKKKKSFHTRIRACDKGSQVELLCEFKNGGNNKIKKDKKEVLMALKKIKQSLKSVEPHDPSESCQHNLITVDLKNRVNLARCLPSDHLGFLDVDEIISTYCF